jgi:hypothetical protein
MRRTRRFRGFGFAHLLAARLKGSNVSAGAELTPSRRPHLSNVSSSSNTPGLVYCTSNRHCPRYTCTHPACIPSSALRRPPTPPNLPLTFIPRPTSKTGLVPKPQVPLVRGGKAWPPFNRLGNSWYTATADRSLAHSRSSRPPATNVQMHTGSDPISLGGDLHPFLAHLVTRSNPACLGYYTRLHFLHRSCATTTRW